MTNPRQDLYYLFVWGFVVFLGLLWGSYRLSLWWDHWRYRRRKPRA